MPKPPILNPRELVAVLHRLGLEDIRDFPPLLRIRPLAWLGGSLLVSAILKPGVKLAPPRAGTAFREPGKRSPALRELCARCGLRGLRLFGAVFAEDDPAVLVNRGDATPRQLRLLLQAARERVYTATGLTLEERLVPPGRGGRL